MTDYAAVGFWEARSNDIIDACDNPERWAGRGWQDDRLERSMVPALLKQHAETVLVVGCGAGRQYSFIQPTGIETMGFDLSPALVTFCQERYPHIRTEWDDVTDPRAISYPRDWRADAVCSTAVLQHIHPDKLDTAIANISTFARKLIILREMVWLSVESDYQWGRDYRELFEPLGWRTNFRSVTDESGIHRTELVVLAK